ncbi:MAG: hypothetical protein LIO81_03440 [Clostridiales bacterium]|nr:hypothetical protein [Clostridiales bacterium]
MQYFFIFFVVFVIMCGVVLLFFLMIRSAALDVTSQVRSTFLRQMEVFDRLYEEKARRLSEVTEQYERMQNNIMPKQAPKTTPDASVVRTAQAATGSSIPAARLVSRDFAAGYRYFKEHFQIDAAAALQDVRKRPLEETSAQEIRVLSRIAEKLSTEVVYKLSSLPGGQQEEVLRACLDGEELPSLERFLRENGGQMDVIRFRDQVVGRSTLYGERPLIFAAQPSELAGADADVVADESICEGVRILRGGKIYDYSV